jgi:hypothetical protein
MHSEFRSIQLLRTLSMKARQLLMGMALAGAAWLAFFGDRTPDGDVALPTPRTLQAATGVRQSKGGDVAFQPRQQSPARAGAGEFSPLVAILRIRDRPPYVEAKKDAPEKVGVLFAANSWDPPPPKPPPVIPVAPQAPPLPYAYLGKKFEDGAWEIYLGVGEDVRVVRAKTTLDSNYRIESITPPTLKLIYIPLGQVQTMSIGTSE